MKKKTHVKLARAFVLARIERPAEPGKGPSNARAYRSSSSMAAPEIARDGGRCSRCSRPSSASARWIDGRTAARLADHSAILARMEAMMRSGDREGALVTFMSEIVLISTDELAAMKARPSWGGLLATIEDSVQQDRALSRYQFDPVRARTMIVPTLLMAGSKTASPELKRSIDSLRQTLPHSTLRIFEGQERHAMDTIPQEFAATVSSFLLEPHR